MTSITDEQKFVDTNFNTIQQFERSPFDELASIVISTLAGILLNFDQSALPDSEWNSQRENILVGSPAAIRQRPNPPLPGLPPGPPPVLPIGILNAAEINIANVQLKYHTAAVNKEKEANLLCTKYAAILQYVTSALLS